MYNKRQKKAVSFIQKGKDHEKWTTSGFKVVLVPLKRKEDVTILTTEIYLWAKYRLWIHCALLCAVEKELTGSGKEDEEVNSILEANYINEIV